MSLAVSLFLHAPLVPTNLLHWLGIMLHAQDIHANDVDGEAIIPIDLDLDLHGGSGVAGSSSPSPRTGDPRGLGDVDASAPKPRPRVSSRRVVDAGGDAAAKEPGDAASDEDTEAGSAEPDAAAPDATAPIPAEGDAGAADAGGEDAAAPVAKLAAPVGAAGDPSKLAGKDPNVQVLLASDRLRKHELGATFSQLLTALPEWAEFFEGTPIDPVKDFDHVLLAGPQFRDFRKVVAVMDYNIPERKIREAMNVVVERTHGHWLEGTPVPAAEITLARDKGVRILALVPEKRLLVLLPKDAKDQLSQLKATKPFAKSNVGILLSIVTPARAFRGLPVGIPDTLKWVRISVTPQPNGEADVDLEALDDSAADAAKHAPEITQAVEGVRRIDLGLFAIEVIDRTQFIASGALIRAHVRVTKRQLRFVMDEVEKIFGKPAAPKDKPIPAAPP
jgi:hypothetical protein